MTTPPRLKAQRSMSHLEGSTLTLHDLGYVVKVKQGGFFSRKTVDKEVLHKVSGIIQPGMNAILGPTGGGKSSLLDLLAGRKDPKGMTGTLLVDGEKQPKNFKCISGYVAQDDVVTGTFTVKESIMFSANLRLPPEVSQHEKEERVEDTICELNLEKCANQRLGNEFIRGVSGGERKRTCIGMELVIKPSVLFLDEPTTGLDASTASAVMTLLKELSLKGRTIVFSIHQPRYSIYRHFDRLMLLSNGETVYHGPAMEALSYFDSIGYHCQPKNNPPDFFLDVILGDIPKSGPNHTADNENIEPDIQDRDNMFEVRQQLSKQLINEFKNSTFNRELHNEIDPIFEAYKRSDKVSTVIIKDFNTSFGSQVRTLSDRCVKNLVRDVANTASPMFVFTFFGFLCGLIYLQLGNDSISGVSDRVGALFFIAMNMTFSNGAGVVTFITQRAIFVHESVSGFYRTSAYFVSKVIFDLLPLRVIPTTLFGILAYFMIGLELSVEKFFIFYLTILLCTCTASAIAFMAGSLTPTFAIANIIFTFITVLMMVFGGIMVNLEEMADWLSWLQYLSLFRYTVNALSINELKDMTFCHTFNFTGNPIENCSLPLGNVYMNRQGINYDTTWDLWQNIVGLSGLLVGFILLALFFLSRVKSYK